MSAHVESDPDPAFMTCSYPRKGDLVRALYSEAARPQGQSQLTNNFGFRNGALLVSGALRLTIKTTYSNLGALKI